MGSADCRGMLAASLRLLADHMDARTFSAGAGLPPHRYHSQRDHGLSAIQAASRAGAGPSRSWAVLDQGPSDAAFAATSQTQCAPCCRNEVVVYVDEVDIHLNPKIGPDWMLCGPTKESSHSRKEPETLLGRTALDPRTGRLTWVEADRKTSDLFILILWQLLKEYPQAKCIHVILDNYKIHHSHYAPNWALASAGGRIRLHFLPPYCPDHNRIERVWKDLHDNITRNHCCRNMQQLMMEVYAYLRCRTHHQRHEYVRTRVA